MDTHWLRMREERRTEEVGGALFSGPRQFELEQCVNDNDNDDDDDNTLLGKETKHRSASGTANCPKTRVGPKLDQGCQMELDLSCQSYLEILPKVAKSLLPSNDVTTYIAHVHFDSIRL